MLQVPWANEAKKALSQIKADVEVKKEVKDPSYKKSPNGSDQPAEKVAFIDFREPFTVSS